MGLGSCCCGLKVGNIGRKIRISYFSLWTERALCESGNEQSSGELIKRMGHFCEPTGQKESLDVSNLDRISPLPSRSNALLKIALFCGLVRIVGGRFGPFAGNPNRQPEIQK